MKVIPLLLFVCYLQKVYGSEDKRPTKIHLSGVKSHVVEGSKVLLQCQVFGGRPAANIYWYNTSELIDDSNPLTTISTKETPQTDGTFETVSELIFSATRFENMAVFRCEADNVVMRNEKERPLEETLNLEVFYAPVVTVKPDNLTINESADFLLYCDYDANPASLVSVRWLRNNSVLDLNDSRFDGGDPEQTPLLVKNAKREDTGEYSCELANQVGSTMSMNRVFVNVQYKPTVAIRFEPTSPIIENDHVNVTVHCEVEEGNPNELLKVQWFKDGMVLTELPVCNDDDDDDKEKSQKMQGCLIDPSKILLQKVNRGFLGNYSCRIYNEAGWSEESPQKLLNVYYEPGVASISVYPKTPLKRKSMVLRCSVKDQGNPKSTRFHWLRGDEVVNGIETAEWTIDPVGLHSRNNFSCYAFNDGGNGKRATIDIDVQVAPAFIRKLPQYSGFLYSDPNIVLSCRVECVPECSMFWFRDGQEITNDNERYFIKNTALPADMRTGDFESILSELHFNFTAWPDHRLDKFKDGANYTCSSSKNSVGLGVRSSTLFGVEFPPENVTITPGEDNIVKGKDSLSFLCSADAFPLPSYQWRNLTNGGDEVLTNSPLLTFPKGNHRGDEGVYLCTAENKHGVAIVKINVLAEL